MKKKHQRRPFSLTSATENKEIRNDEENLVLSEVEVDTENKDASNRNEYASEDQQGAIMAKIQEATEALQKAGAHFGNKDSIPALDRFIQRTNSIQSTNQFTSCALRSGGAGRGKIPCQPTSISRRSTGRPRGAAPLCKGRRPAGAAAPPSKRPRNLALNIQNNVANAKSHGSGH